MLRIRSCIAAHILSSTSPVSISSLQRFLAVAAAAAPPISPSPSFAVQDYLVATSGLSRPQALKASTKISHLKSPSKPDAVLTFLAGLGLSSADVAAVVAKDPRLLCAKVGNTLAPNVLELTALGLSRTEVAHLVSLAPGSFRCRSIVSNLPYCLSLFVSYDKLLQALKFKANLLVCNLERTVKPNVAILRECGLGDCDIAKLGITVPRMLTTDVERLWAMVACAEGLGVPRGSGMFRLALKAAAFLGEEKIAARVDYLKSTFMWSDAEVGIAVCRAPTVLMRSKDTLQRKSEFLISEVGLEPAYIARRPVMLGLSLEGRLSPRYYVLKFLKQNGLLKHDRDYYSAVVPAEKVFVQNYICPHKKAAPHLAEDYADTCRGQVPTRFRFA